jgi:glutamate dehydrogenase
MIFRPAVPRAVPGAERPASKCGSGPWLEDGVTNQCGDEPDEIIEQIQSYARERLRSEQAEIFLPFVGRYYARATPEDLLERTVADLYGSALAHVRLARTRQPGEPKVAVFSPDFDEHGFASPHTVVEVVTDDMPFLVDSLTMELRRHDLGLHVVIHPVLTVRRSADGTLVSALSPDDKPNDDPTGDDAVHAESYLHIEVDRQTDPTVLEQIRGDLVRVLGDVAAAVADWPTMLDRAASLALELDADTEAGAPGVPGEDRAEIAAFLRWLTDGHFTFLGYREYEVVSPDSDGVLQAVEGSGLGILRDTTVRPKPHRLSEIPSEARREILAPSILNLTKTRSRATVHRDNYLDYVGIKRPGPNGERRERRFLGLYTTKVYKQWPTDIPILRNTVRAVLERAACPGDSHDGKALVEILDSYPRDELFQSTADELYADARSILALRHRPKLRLRLRPDTFGRFFSCFVDLPVGRLTTVVRRRFRDILMSSLHGVHCEESSLVTDSVLARLHFVIYTEHGSATDMDTSAIEARLGNALRVWNDDLADALVDQFGEERGLLLHQRYADAFPASYQGDFSARTAVSDIRRLEAMRAGTTGERLGMHLYRPLESLAGEPRLTLYRGGSPLTLSDVLPLLENMGMAVVDQRPYEVHPSDGEPVWIYDYGLRWEDHLDLDAGGVRERLADALKAAWRGEMESDRFNRLVLSAGLEAREVTVLRAYTKYLRQAGTTFGRDFMAGTLTRNPEIARQLVDLVWMRFDPDIDADTDRELGAKQIVADIMRGIDAVASLNEDRVLRSLLGLVTATLRTNLFQHDQDGRPKPWLSLKLDSREIADLPQPRPMCEVFVYSPRTEGVHLRGGEVARGGLRWSDRPEDFRTEILGLVKAQVVKNAVIVPVGAKGGFVVKKPPPGRDALQTEVITCYSTFIRGLLDVTDNLVDGEVVPPERVVRHDGDDPYLVVAADKGTATFSDIANEISGEYGFWLGDAFASGGSVGYDHKAMGITARGAWVSVRRHFQSLGVDVQNDDFTAVGVGDMSGDVFGNGMLLSRHIRLVAAFDHRHIFLDPDPDPMSGHDERARLFALPRSSWADYDLALISEGGGVFPRTAKAVPLSPEVQTALGVDALSLSPDELIMAILRAPVDLLFNGGIGTYVKASSETNAQVGDKNNDGVRIDADTLRCRVIGEGGNLGFTQRGRIEFALRGGLVNTDAIDNAAGVDCSDHEVNIKILLDGVVRNGDLTGKQRNLLLAGMTDDIAARVLEHNDAQTRALYIATAQASSMRDVHLRYLDALESSGRLHRALELLPTAEELDERGESAGLSMPELAVLLAYTKIELYRALLASDVPDDPALGHLLDEYFPEPIRARFAEHIARHPLRREIVATCLTNNVVDHAGTSLLFRLEEETGRGAPEIARTHTAAREIFMLSGLWAEIRALDGIVPTTAQISLFLEVRRVVERATRWLLRNRPQPLDLTATVAFFAPSVPTLRDQLPELLTAADAAALSRAVEGYTDAGVPDELARRIASLPALFAALDITEVADVTGRSLVDAAAVHFQLGEQLRLDWLRQRILELPRDEHWQALARGALRDTLYTSHAALTTEVLRRAEPATSAAVQVRRWLEETASSASRCVRVLDEMADTGCADLAILTVALREVGALVELGQRRPVPPSAT